MFVNNITKDNIGIYINDTQTKLGVYVLEKYLIYLRKELNI